MVSLKWQYIYRCLFTFADAFWYVNVVCIVFMPLHWLICALISDVTLVTGYLIFSDNNYADKVLFCVQST